MLEHHLKAAGLNEKEASVYLAILELGESSVQRIADKAGIKRTTVYDVIESLKEKGLIGNTLKGKRRKFFVDDPRGILRMLDEKRNKIEKIIPDLLSKSGAFDKKPRSRFFEGIESMKEIYHDILKHSDAPIKSWMTEASLDMFDRDFIEFFNSNRIKNKIWAQMIGPDTPRLREFQNQDAKFLRKTILDRHKVFPFGVEITLYGNGSIGMISFEEKIGLIFESQKLSLALQNAFDGHWTFLGG
ncbi:MAG: helix-turn-helix domain-containing protein [Candidatus Taylorbacteria bacterium]|nr:helix-turn-helix domain-containing protein [Candidatus Taylorbacteria bacterium]